MAEPETRAGSAQAQANGTAKAQAPSKWAAVTQVLAERGKATTPTQIRDELKSRFNLDIGLNTASTYKRDILRKQAEAKGKGKQARAKTAVKMAPLGKKPTAPKKATSVSPAPAPAAKTGSPSGGFGLEDIQAARSLLARLGAERFKGLINVLAK
jgi:hypothetical protein